MLAYLIFRCSVSVHWYSRLNHLLEHLNILSYSFDMSGLWSNFATNNNITLFRLNVLPVLQ